MLLKSFAIACAGVVLAGLLTAMTSLPPAGGGPTYTVPAAAEKTLPPAERKSLPNVAFVDAKGAPQTLSRLRGRTVLVVLWATNCGPCIKQMESLDRLQAELAGSGFEVLALAQDPGGAYAVQRFYEQQGLKNLKVFLDPGAQAARSLGARGIPTGVLVDAQGREAGRAEGAHDWGKPDTVAAIRQVITGK